MSQFLYKVAEDIIRKHGTNLSDVVIVFPSKRASLFMNQHLMAIADKPMFSPRYVGILDLFRSKTKLTVADKIKSICTLYRVYRKYIPGDEILDRFWGWGELMLKDFDDIDKHLADARLVFSNVRDLHAFDTIDYLSEDDKELLKRFFAEFSDNHESKIKQRFELLWNQLYDIYTEFNKTMREQGLAYEGAMYRDVAEHVDQIEWRHEKYIFVGFNALLDVEQRLFESLKEKGLAYFYWDFDRYYVDDPKQEAGRLVEKWLVKFPNELDIKDETIYSNFTNEKRVTYLAAATENIQARYISRWLEENHRIDGGTRTAIVLSDESLLKSVIHYLPEEVSGKANITIGYPLSQTPIFSLVDSFLSLHIHGYNVQEQVFMLARVQKLLRHPYVHILSERAMTLPVELNDQRVFFPTAEELCLDDPLKLLFEPIDNSIHEVSGILLERLHEILRTLGVVSGQNWKAELAEAGLDPDDELPTYEEQLMQESIYRMYNIVNRLADLVKSGDLDVEPNTMQRLIGQIVEQTEMPFHGEPAAGVQIMGVPDTRNLDFDHLLILSCNEGNFPRGVSDSSLIPYSVRKAYGLSTADSKVGLYAFYFYRLLQRCSDISIAFNNSTDDGHTKQMSRYMLQLMVEADRRKMHIRHMTLTARQSPQRGMISEIEKDETIMAALWRIKYLSPSAINRYLRCPLQFYFNTIAGIHEADATTIDDQRMFGTIFHTAAEHMYKEIATEGGLITPEAVDKLLKERNHITIRRLVDGAFSEDLFRNRKPHYDGLQLINREVICRFIQQLLTADSILAPFRIEGLEAEVYEDMTFEVGGKKRTIQIGGYIDRLDRITTDEGEEVLRVIDYKTGRKMQSVLAGVDEVFDPAKIESHSDYYLQAMLYSMLVRHSDKPTEHKGEKKAPLNTGHLAVRPALLFIQRNESVKDPVLKFGSSKSEVKPISDILDYEKEFREHLDKLIHEILDPAVSFRPTEEQRRCDTCPFLKLCQGKSQ